MSVKIFKLSISSEFLAQSGQKVPLNLIKLNVKRSQCRAVKILANFFPYLLPIVWLILPPKIVNVCAVTLNSVLVSKE